MILPHLNTWWFVLCVRREQATAWLPELLQRWKLKGHTGDRKHSNVAPQTVSPSATSQTITAAATYSLTAT